MESGAIFVPIENNQYFDYHYRGIEKTPTTKRHRSAPVKENRLQKYFDRIREIQHRRLPGKRHYSDSDILEILFILDSALTRVQFVKKQKHKRVKSVKPSLVCPKSNDNYSDVIKGISHLSI